MRPFIVIAICLIIFVGSTYAVLRVLRMDTPPEQPLDDASDAGTSFSATREGIDSGQVGPASQTQSQAPESFITIARSGTPSGTVVLLQPRQPSAVQPALVEKKPEAVKQQLDEAFNLEVSGTGAITQGSPSVVSGKGIIVVSNHALYSWSDEYSGGESLFSIDASGKWKLISMGGGVWSVEGLVLFGVPRATAEQLVAQKPWGQR